jgi:hypothetical protein
MTHQDNAAKAQTMRVKYPGGKYRYIVKMNNTSLMNPPAIRRGSTRTNSLDFD